MKRPGATRAPKTLQTSELIFLAGMDLGRLRWDNQAHKASFEPARTELKDLAMIAWSCPVEARLDIQGYALEAGLGTCPALCGEDPIT